MARKKRQKRSMAVTVDFSDVESREVIPEGDYIARIHDVSKEQGEKGPYFAWVMKIPSGEYKGKDLYYNTSLTKQSLWSLRAFIEALGDTVPKGKMDVDPEKYKGQNVGVSVEIEKYKGRDKNTVVDVFSPEESEEEEGEEEEEEGEESEEEEEEEGSEEEDEEEEDEEEEEEEEPPAKRAKAKSKAKKSK